MSSVGVRIVYSGNGSTTGHMYTVFRDSNGNIEGVYGQYPGGVDSKKDFDAHESKSPGQEGHPDYSRDFPVSPDAYERALEAARAAENSSGQWQLYDPFSNSCVDFAWWILKQAGIMAPTDQFEGYFWPKDNRVPLDDYYYEYFRRPEFNREFRRPFNDAKTWNPPRDPIILDLNNNGLETVGLAANIHFDHDSDGVLTKTGWVGKDDALLVWDRNANGTIDTGAELFGDFTPMPDGTLAPNGFAALAALDANADGIIDASDPAFAELKLWIDADQNGITGTGELVSLADAGIVSLNLTNSLKNQRLNNGNTLAREGSFTRADGSDSAMGEFHLATDTFDSRFADAIEVPEALKALPNMLGAGKVRELQQASAQSATLAGTLTEFQAATTRNEQQAILDRLLGAWAGTSGMQTLDDRAAGKFRIEYMAFGNTQRSMDQEFFKDINHLDTLNKMSMNWPRNVDNPIFTASFRQTIAEWTQKLLVLEAFNGQYFFNLPETKNPTPSAVNGLIVANTAAQAHSYTSVITKTVGFQRTLAVQFSTQQLGLLDQAYNSLRESVYGSLVLQTRLKPYLDAIELIIDSDGIRLDATPMNQMLADKRLNDPENALADLLELDRYAGSFLAGTNWDGLAGFDQMIDTLPNSAGISALLDAFKVRQLTGDDDKAYLTDSADIVLAGDGNDTLHGYGGNDRLFGQGGDDRIYGGAGDDLISGGAGSDLLYGESGADTYVFGRGFGHDTIIDYAENGVRRDTVRFLGLRSEDIQVTGDTTENLIFTIMDTGETLSVPRLGSWWGDNGVGQYVFDDGVVWSHDDALRTLVAPATEGDDVIHGSSAGDTITGKAGDDLLIGNAGNDIIDGGAGNDLLVGSTSQHWIWENGQYRIERGTTPTVSANGNDTYLFGRGDGQDTVIDGDYTEGNTDTLRFKEGVLPADVRFIRNGNDLVLAIRDTDDQVTLKQYFDEDWRGNNGPWLIERIAFADGTALSFADVQSMLFAGSNEAETIVGSRADDALTGQAGDDILLGGGGRDLLDGGAGNDVLRGGGKIDSWGRIYDGDATGDTYRFGRGDGHDTIIEDSWRPEETDRIELKSGLTTADVRLEHVRSVNGWQASNDLKLTIRDTGETLTVKNHFNESKRYAVEEIVFADGTVWGQEEILNQVLIGDDGDDHLRGFSWRDDVLAGGTGNDVLEGGAGSDTYKFGLGDGQDLIIEGQTTGEDVVELGAGITPADVSIRWTLQGDMALTLADGSRLTVRGQANSWSNEIGIETLRFADGTTWDRAMIAERALSTTAGDDHVVGGYGEDTHDGGAGNDHFQDLGGYDTYHFGVGDGQDVIEDSSGRFIFKPGIGQNDIVFSRDGNDLIATIGTTTDSVRIKDWLNAWQRIDRFEFDNGARLSISDVLTKLNVGEGSEVLYGSPGEDVLAGTEKDSVLYGREGNDFLSGGAGRDQLFGEAGDDMLDGGADRDELYGGAGNNTYILAPGSGLDTVYASAAAVANDTVRFAPGIRPEDISVQMGQNSPSADPGAVGYHEMVVGIGGNDALVLRNWNWDDLGQGALKRFVFEDGTEWTLADLITRADGGTLGWQQRYSGGPETLIGSQGDDRIYDYTGESVRVEARGNDDHIQLAAGDDIVSAGAGNDSVRTGQGDDLIAGEAGDDTIDAGEGDDTIVFNHGDGHDRLRAGAGTDTLSFGASITPAMLAASVDRDGRVVLIVDGGAGGSITLEETRADNLPGDLERIQFIDANGQARIFDFAGWLRANGNVLLATTADAALAFDGTGFELTGSAAPAGGLEAIAFAQAGNLFASANLANNTPTDGDDVLYGTAADDTLDAGAGNDIVIGLAGDDIIHGGEGNDLILGGDGDDVLNGGAGDDIIYGGWGADTLAGGTGRDELHGEWGGDTYRYQAGDGEVIIDDDHRVLSWGYGGSYGGEVPAAMSMARESYDYGGGYGGSYGGEWWYGGAIVDDAPNILSLGAGIRQEDLRYSEHDGDLLIEFANRPGDRIILRGYTPDRETRTRSVDVIRFADGSEIVASSIEATGKTEVGGDDGAWLNGTAFADTLIGGDGDDWLEGKGGADRLVGGAGSDTYRIHKQSGRPASETLIGETWRPQDSNRIELTGEVNADDLRLEFDGRDLLLRWHPDGDTVRFAGFDPRAPGMRAPIDEISLPWLGASLSFDDLLARGVRIIGTPNDDVLEGTQFADWIEGREANDTMQGGAGGDIYIIDADGGSDTIIDSETGDAPNVLVLPEGAALADLRLSYDTEGFLVIDLIQSGNRVRLSGFDPKNPLGPRAIERFRFGLHGDEISYEELLARGFDIVGTPQDDVLRGTQLADRVRGGAGNDLIEATPGGDWLAGEGGNDIYVVNLGDGIVTIDDVAADEAGNVLRFGPGIDPAWFRNSLRFESDGNGEHVMLIPYGGDGDLVRLTGFNPDDVLGTHAVDHFEFADGTVVDYATLVSWTFVVEGDNTGNTLTGTNVADRLYGYDGDDLMASGAGDDVLTGGTGNDVMRGGSGRDAYVLNLGDGEDTIEDDVEAGIGNIITFGPGISREDVRVEFDGDDLLVHYGSGGDRVRVTGYAPAGPDGGTVIDTFEFADGSTVTLRQFMNRAPEMVHALDDQIVLEDAAFSMTLPDDLFIDPDGDEVQTWVTLSGYATPPEWLRYDHANRTLFGTPDNDDVGTFEVVVHGKDAFGASLTRSFQVTVHNTNDAPEVGTILADQQATEDQPFAFTVPVDAFRDVDAGDVLTLSATQANGSVLPAWLGFDPVSRTFSGTPTNDHVGNLSLTLTATDLAGAQTSQTFGIGVTNVNDAPEAGIPLTNQTVRIGNPASWQLPDGAFVDVDAGDVLTYTASLADGSALPDWLGFDTATGSFTGTPSAAGNYAIRVTATDLAGAQVSQRFSLDVLGGGPITAPDVATVTEDRKLLACGNVLTNDSAPYGGKLAVTDPGIRRGEHGVLTLLPNGSYAYVLNNHSAKVQGLGKDETLTERFSYQASDGKTLSTGELTVNVQGTNDAPILSRSLRDVQLAKGKAFSWQMPAGSFTDRDRNDTLSYTATLANGKPLPTWLKFDAQTQNFSGTLPANSRGSIDVRVTASDGHGDNSMASDVFRISFGNTTVLPSEQKNAAATPTSFAASSLGTTFSQAAGNSPQEAGNAATDDSLSRFLDQFKPGEKAPSALPVLDANWLDRWTNEVTGQKAQASPSQNAQTASIEQHWQQLTQALGKLDAERQAAPSWLGKGQGADLSGLSSLLSGHGAASRTGQDVVGLVTGGTQLKGFAGLREGVSKLLC